MLHDHEEFSVHPYSPLATPEELSQILVPFGPEVSALMVHVFDQATLFSTSVNPHGSGVGSWLVPLSTGAALVIRMERMVPLSVSTHSPDLAFGLDLRVVDASAWDEELAGHVLPDQPGVVTPAQLQAFLSGVYTRLMEVLDGHEDTSWTPVPLRSASEAQALPVTEEFSAGPREVQVVREHGRDAVCLWASGVVCGRTDFLQVVVQARQLRFTAH